MIRLLAAACLCACARAKVPQISTQDGNVVVSLGDDSTFAIHRPSGNMSFPSAIEGVLSSLAKTDVDVKNNNAAAQTAASALDKRASRVERELGLGQGKGTEGGLGTILKAQLDLLTKMHSADVDAGKTTKNSEGLLEKILKASLATATASSKGGSKVEWVAGMSAAGMGKSYGTGTAIHVGGRGFVTGMPIYQCKFAVGKESSVTQAVSAVKSDALSCPPVPWKGKFNGKTAIEVDMSVLENGRAVPTVTGAASLKHSIMDAPPVIVQIMRARPTTAKLACTIGATAGVCEKLVAKKKDLNGDGYYRLDLTLKELDEGDVNDATLAATSSDQNLVPDKAIQYLKEGKDRRTVLVPLKKRGTVVITLVLKNKAGSAGVPVSVPIEFKLFTYVDPAGLLAYFPFNGGSCEHSTAPKRIPGVRQGGSRCMGGSGLIGGAGHFNNQEHQRFYYGGSGAVKFTSGDWALSVWIKTDTCYNNQIPLHFRAPGDGGCCLDMIDHHAQVRFYGRSHGWFAYRYVNNCGSWNGKWINHIYVSNKKAKRWEIYVNGQAQGGLQHNRWKDLSGMYLDFLGGRPGFGTNGLGGYADELIMWNRALTPTEARAVYQMGKDKKEFAAEI